MRYRNPIALTAEVGRYRIFSPFAYEVVRHTNIVPITVAEAARYPAHYPIVWRKVSDRFVLVVVRSLLDDGRGHFSGTRRALEFLPALCRAYPFMLADAPQQDEEEPNIGFDHVSADQPTDVGAPVCMPDGRPSRGTEQRVSILRQYFVEERPTRVLAKDLAALDVLEPWNLSFDDVEGQRLTVPDLFVISTNAIKTGRFSHLLAKHGSCAAELIGWHRISIYRAGQLLVAARMDLQKNTAPTSATRLSYIDP